MKIRCIVKPNSRHEEGIELIDGTYIVRVKAPAAEGKANEAVKQVLAAYLGVSPSRVEMTAGHASRHKTFTIS
jgi:uncharacterized protein YggU (UPF0235/DUF167 family)